MAVAAAGLPPVADWQAGGGESNAAPRPAGPEPDPRPVHRALPGYQPTPLVEVPSLAAQLDLGGVWVKDESVRLGLPSFKVLGASYALQRALRSRAGGEEEWTSFEQWREAAAALAPLTLVTATDGNHGRALAYLARLLGLAARILVPAGMPPARLAAIGAEGAVVEQVEGSYDDAIAALHGIEDERNLVISDTSWSGYDEVPRWVTAGYATIFAEIAEQLEASGAGQPDAVLVQAGVGSLASAAITHWPAGTAGRPAIVAVEPADAACVLSALREGEPRLVPGPHRSIMAGLNCGLVSPVALPLLAGGLAGAISIGDEHARSAVRLLHEAGVRCGETGAAGVAGLLALRASAPEVWSALGLDGAERVLTLCTEGVTDSDAIGSILSG